jgi:DNA polymerase-3 subunit delta'
MTVWDRLRGSRAAEGIANQVQRGEATHAWLLVGSAGSGKLPTAVALSAALNCSVEPLVGCGECSSCLRTLRRRHPDVHHITPEGPIIPVDVIRESIIPEANRSPFEGNYQVFIIEEAERMHPAAQNALLKTLEEPQPHTVFVLISDRAEELLETVHSRCRVIRLEPVPEERIVEFLQQEGAPLETALLCARLSEGDLDKARALAFDDEVAERRRNWTRLPRRLATPNDALDAATEILDEAKGAGKDLQAAQKEELKELAEAFGEKRGTAQARNALEKRHKREVRRLEGEILANALRTLASFYRDIVAIRRGGDEAVANIDLLEELRGWAASEIPDAAFVEAIERCVVATGTLPRNANAQLTMEATLVWLAHLAPPRARIPS